jgi:signal transduction histidine kinase
LKVWRCRVGQSLPGPWHEFVLDALSSGQSQQTEVKCDGRIFSLTFAPIVDTNYVNVYGLDITERKKAEERLLKHQAKLKAMASKMLMTEERQRQHLAIGLHDEVCQKLVLTKLALESSLSLVSDSNVLASLKIACAGIGETIEKANSLTFEFSNPILRQLGFVVALEKYLTEEIQQKYGIAYELESDEQLGTMQDEIKNCLFRVARELLTNVVKHAHARKIKVSVHESRGRIYVDVQDDGVGFKESQDGAKASQITRFGLFSIREQLEYLGGHLEIESEPGRGTTAKVVVPLRDEAAL